MDRVNSASEEYRLGTPPLYYLYLVRGILMAKLSDETYEEFKKISDEKGITYESEFETQRQANNLVELVRLLSTQNKRS